MTDKAVSPTLTSRLSEREYLTKWPVNPDFIVSNTLKMRASIIYTLAFNVSAAAYTQSQL